MKTKIRHFLWEIFGRPELPPKDFSVKARVNNYTGRTWRHLEMANLYLQGHDIQTIANIYCVTRERIRQCVWKAYRESLK